MNHDDIYEKFIGNGKIQALNIIPTEEGKWILRYKDGKKIYELECEGRDFLDKLLVEFGGKNPETCRAPDKFLIMDGSWMSEDLNELGHRIVKVKFSGSRIVRSTSYPVVLPDECGLFTIVGARRKIPDKIINQKLVDREFCDFTLAFNSPSQFDNLCEFINKHDSLSKLIWHTMLLGTESRETGANCVWKRLKAGDGTKRMVLELIGLNGNHYTECIRQELFNAAGDMFYAPCQRIKVKKKKEQTMEICMFAAEDGNIDLSNYEAATYNISD